MDDVRLRADVVTQGDFKNVLVVWLFQLLVCGYVVANTTIVLAEVLASQLTASFGASRLIVMLVMHILIVSELDQALKMMKYALNHPWKFRSFHLAFLTGLLQFTICVIIEASNVYVLLAKSGTQFDTVANFVIMLVVAEFDNFFYRMRSADDCTRMLTGETDIFKWETSTSADAAAKTEKNKLAPESVLRTEDMHERPEYIRYSLSQRSCANKVYYALFRAINLFYNSVYYYWFPWMASSFLALYLLTENENIYYETLEKKLQEEEDASTFY